MASNAEAGMPRENDAIAVHGGMHEVLVTQSDEGSVEVVVYNAHTGDRFGCTVDEAAIRGKAEDDRTSPFIGHPPPAVQDPEQLASLLRDALSAEAGLAVSIPYACVCACVFACTRIHACAYAHMCARVKPLAERAPP
jgi:hypothetical protein